MGIRIWTITLIPLTNMAWAITRKTAMAKGAKEEKIWMVMVKEIVIEMEKEVVAMGITVRIAMARVVTVKMAAAMVIMVKMAAVKAVTTEKETMVQAGVLLLPVDGVVCGLIMRDLWEADLWVAKTTMVTSLSTITLIQVAVIRAVMLRIWPKKLLWLS